jgi:hypothetical protein
LGTEAVAANPVVPTPNFRGWGEKLPVRAFGVTHHLASLGLTCASDTPHAIACMAAPVKPHHDSRTRTIPTTTAPPKR